MKSAAQARMIRFPDNSCADGRATIFEELNRYLGRGEIYELLVTDGTSLMAGGTSLMAGSSEHRVSSIGCAEFISPAVAEVGDDVFIGGQLTGKIAGFQSRQHPNLCHILVAASSQFIAEELKFHVGDAVSIVPGAGIRNDAAVGIVPSVIIGFGHAGKMHARCIAKARQRIVKREAVESAPIFVVDAASIEDVAGLPECRIIGTLDDLPADVRGRAIAHICTPPDIRSNVIQNALAVGIHRLIVEKPLASTTEEMIRLAGLYATSMPDLLVVSNWTVSNLTRKIQSFIERRLSDVTGIKIRQRKCRISRTRTIRDRISAFDVEMPHMVSLAQMLGGPGLVVKDARAWDMVVEGRVIPEMGGAEITLEGKCGLAIELYSDHLAPLVERVIHVEFRDGGRLEGYYPCTGLDHYSQLRSYDNTGEQNMHEYIEDDTLTQFFVEAYNYFLGHGLRPLSDFEFHAKVCSILHEASRLNVSHTKPPQV